MTWSAPTTPPEPDELEISLFGPGFGECIVAHLGWGDWILVDSCVAPDGKSPAGLLYLKGLGVDPGTAVKRVVATHWHNDHVRGLARTMEQCTRAKFICSGAFFKPEFVAFTDLWKRQGLTTSPVSELTHVLDAINRSEAFLRGSTGECPVSFAIANRCLWRRSRYDSVEGDSSAVLYSLSPSDAAVRKSLEDIASFFPQDDVLRKPVARRPNQFSVVLWLRVAGVQCLLGADMEEAGNPCGGWKIIVESSERLEGTASLCKVPHHGSATGEYPALWTQLLQGNPVAMVTPFRSGRVRLPTREDTDRICGRTPHAFITAGFRERSSRGRTGSVNRTIHETVRYIRMLHEAFGQVRARRRLHTHSADWTVETFGDAMRLDRLYAQS